MSTAIALEAAETVDYVNPIIAATCKVFRTMIGCEPTRTGLQLKDDSNPAHDVSAVIGVTGRAQGTIVLSLSKSAALTVLERMIGEPATEITPEVCDAVGELTNMIAGTAKARLAELELSISIPNVVSGEDHKVHFPSSVQPMSISFTSEIGDFTVEVGFTKPV